jgi:general secretion pathway protein E
MYQDFLNILKRNNKLSAPDLAKVKRLQKSAMEPLPNLLMKLGFCSERDIASAMAELSQLELVEESEYSTQSPFSEDVSLRFLKENHIIGQEESDEAITVIAMDPEAKFNFDSLFLATGKDIIVKVGVSSEIDKALEIQYGEGKSQMGQIFDSLDSDEIADDDIEHLKDMASEEPVIKMVNLIMKRALETRASDVHIEPFDNALIIRLRIDGVLQDIEAPPVSSVAAVISRIKIMANLNIAERRLPQDGRIKMQMLGKEIDLRVSTVPTMYGESVVIRLLDKENAVLDFTQLGFTGRNADAFIDILSRPNGIVLITGPTGSGKSTSLYAALKQLNSSESKIITVEDPVEYQMDGVNQIQTKPQIGLTFATALRSIVRQDPDIIMIGEMRDLETAKIAVQSALTGHLVLSTLHTNDAASGVTRLLDMGLEEYLISSTVNGILAQRLVRKLCPNCKKPHPVSEELIEQMQLRKYQPEGKIVMYVPEGCDECAGIGYRGRVAIIEFLKMTDPIRALVMVRAISGDIQKLAVEEGMLTMNDDGMVKVIQGVTTLEEVMSHVSVDNISQQNQALLRARSLIGVAKKKIDI